MLMIEIVADHKYDNAPLLFSFCGGGATTH